MTRVGPEANIPPQCLLVLACTQLEHDCPRSWFLRIHPSSRGAPLGARWSCHSPARAFLSYIEVWCWGIEGEGGGDSARVASLPAGGRRQPEASPRGSEISRYWRGFPKYRQTITRWLTSSHIPLRLIPPMAHAISCVKQVNPFLLR